MIPKPRPRAQTSCTCVGRACLCLSETVELLSQGNCLTNYIFDFWLDCSTSCNQTSWHAGETVPWMIWEMIPEGSAIVPHAIDRVSYFHWSKMRCYSWQPVSLTLQIMQQWPLPLLEVGLQTTVCATCIIWCHLMTVVISNSWYISLDATF